MLTDIYAAGEAPIPGVTLEALAAAVRDAARGGVRVVPALDDVPAAVAAMARPGDLVITLGAGSIGGVGERILEAIRAPARRSPQAPGGRDEGQGSRREELPPRPRPAGARAAGCARCSAGASHEGCSSLVAHRARGYRVVEYASITRVCFGCSRVRVHGNVRHLERRSPGHRQRSPGRPHPHRRTWPGRAAELLESPWLAEVALRRVLPSTIDVYVSERRPFGLCRHGKSALPRGP